MSIILVSAFMALSSAISCQVTRDSIKVKFPQQMSESIRYFAVIRGKEWFYVVDKDHQSAKFPSRSGEMSIDIKAQTGVEYIDGRPIEKNVFSHPGRYRLIFTDNLDTELEEMDSVSCNVRIGK